MRCPKCSYISFDLVEACAKCGKDISKAVEELKGTVADVEPPAFLNLDYNSYETQEAEEPEEFAGDEDAVMELDVEDDEEMVDFSLDDETAAADTVDFEVEKEEVAVEAETDFDVGVEEAEEEALDIADLAPEEEVSAKPAGGEFAFETETGEEHEAGELEDLEVEGIDLEGSSAPKGGKVMPSVKTGTALDDFDIDLGELISPKKDKSS